MQTRSLALRPDDPTLNDRYLDSNRAPRIPKSNSLTKEFLIRYS